MPPLPICATVDCFQKPPQVDAYECAPATTDGEITEVLMTAVPLTSSEIASAVDFEARIDNDVAADNSIVRLKVTGSLPEPEITETEVEGGNIVVSARKKFTVNFEFFNDSETNYNAARHFMHCAKPMIVYYVMGGKIYGGTTNIEDGISTIVNIKPSSEGRDSFLKYTGSFSWRATTLPERAPYVLAE